MLDIAMTVVRVALVLLCIAGVFSPQFTVFTVGLACAAWGSTVMGVRGAFMACLGFALIIIGGVKLIGSPAAPRHAVSPAGAKPASGRILLTLLNLCVALPLLTRYIRFLIVGPYPVPPSVQEPLYLSGQLMEVGLTILGVVVPLMLVLWLWVLHSDPHFRHVFGPYAAAPRWAVVAILFPLAGWFVVFWRLWRFFGARRRVPPEEAARMEGWEPRLYRWGICVGVAAVVCMFFPGGEFPIYMLFSPLGVVLGAIWDLRNIIQPSPTDAALYFGAPLLLLAGLHQTVATLQNGVAAATE